MNKDLQKVALRYQAVYVANTNEEAATAITEPAANFVANLAKLGFTVEEKLLHQLNRMNPAELLGIYENFVETMQLRKNWMPLVKGWDIPTEEKRVFHILTWIANIMPGANGTELSCGHLIPDGTFHLERYNGCPFCGQPFKTGGEIVSGQASKLKVLTVWSEAELKQAFENLLLSKTTLDATQVDSLRLLLPCLPLPEVEVSMKETQALVIDYLKMSGQTERASTFFETPVDIMRYLWYKHTGSLQIVEPSALISLAGKKQSRYAGKTRNRSLAISQKKNELRLKYGRAESRIIAQWLNDLPLSAEKAAELMHPKRAMWVRFIRALRLAEYSRLPGMEKLRKLMDVFYNERYEVAAGEIEKGRMKYDAEATFSVLKQRPGLFARSLFANMLWFGSEDTLKEFNVVISNIPSRLLVTLAMYAKDYFDPAVSRTIKTASGTKTIGANKFISLYEKDSLIKMAEAVEITCLSEMERRFAQKKNTRKRIYIEQGLFNMPVPVGDRSQAVQDLPAALMGTRFPVAGNKVRLFMQWGEGLKKQHMDMDLSCRIAYEDRVDECAFYNLSVFGAKHSGDIRAIPDKVGTAEYVELDIEALAFNGARYATFTCNAYSNGAITPNLVVGWMDSENKMAISLSTGVAYDPSCVQQMVRVTRALTKGLVFGVLDIKAREITWLEISFGGQTIRNLNSASVEGMFRKLNSKMSVGSLLTIKAKAQEMEVTGDPGTADECYDRKWAQDAAAITKLLID